MENRSVERSLNLNNTQVDPIRMRHSQDKSSKEPYFPMNNASSGAEMKMNSNFSFNYSIGMESLNMGNLNNNGNNNFPPPLPQEDQNLNYYQEYCRLFIANVVLTTQMKELVAEKNELANKLMRLEKKTEDFQNSSQNITEDERRKRFRRTAGEIDRHYKCIVENCAKSYGSEGSLNQHIKLKHPDLYSEMLKNQTILSQKNASDEDKSLSLDQSQSRCSSKLEKINK